MARLDAPLERLAALHPRLIDLSLDRISVLLAKLGHPERKMPGVIHVAGTNGKGSTIAFLRAMLEAGGARVHVFTSPHLVRFNERIRLGAVGGGALVSDDAFLAALERVEAVNAGAPITVFEITTAVAFVLFAEHDADYTLVEVGLGGNFDATNVLETPLASVITPVSMDHREHLGDTLEKIAGEKAGILKRGCPVIVAPQAAAAVRVIRRQAARLGCPLLVGEEDFHAHEEGGRLLYQTEDTLLDLPLPRLIGRHQLLNAATAITTLRKVAPARATPEALAAGLLRAEWPARFQRLYGALVALAPQGAELWLDGGHNADGARVLAETIAELEARSARPLVLVLGAMARKDVREILEPFKGLVQEILAVPIDSPLAHAPAAIAQTARGMGFAAACAGGLEDSLRFLAAREWATPPRVLIAGSLYLAGEALVLDGTLPI